MALDITFTLTDADLARFQAIVDRARSSLKDEAAEREIETAARQLISDMDHDALPEFISSRMSKLNVMLDMIADEEWQLSQDDRHGLLSALAYLCDPEDLIADHVPGFGYLDDAIYAEIVFRELKEEIKLYQEFCAYRSDQERRRAGRGEDIRISRESWLADKRAALHKNMRARRAARKARGQWSLRIF